MLLSSISIICLINSFIFFGSNSGYLNESFYNLAADTTYTGDNNSFVKTTNAHWQRANSDVATTLAGWQTYSGQDAHSTLA